jgi:predicted YcjX-like family ATPase
VVPTNKYRTIGEYSLNSFSNTWLSINYNRNFLFGYFKERQLKSDIIKYAGKWLLEEFDGLYDPYAGIPNNLSESYNAVMKQENDWKELPDDMLVLGFHYLQNFDYFC